MKKLILVLAILVVASPAFAVLDVNIVKLAGNQVQIRYTGADPCNLPRGFALAFEVNSTADVCGISAYKTGESTAASKGFGIYPARIVIDACGVVTGWGNPLADPCDPGAGDQVLPSKNFVLEFGSLYAPPSEAVNAPGADGNLCVLSFDPNGATPSFTIKMTGEGLFRVTGGAKTTHGVVHEKGETADVNKTLTIATAVDCPAMDIGQKFLRTGCDPCLAADINVTTVIRNKWVWLGKPKCWCCKAQKCGNGNYTGGSKSYIDASDLSSLKLSWQKAYTVAGYLPCVDFNMSGTVDAADLSILKLHWQKNVGSSGCL
jgi:hypothetical protein